MFNFRNLVAGVASLLGVAATPVATTAFVAATANDAHAQAVPCPPGTTRTPGDRNGGCNGPRPTNPDPQARARAEANAQAQARAEQQQQQQQRQRTDVSQQQRTQVRTGDVRTGDNTTTVVEGSNVWNAPRTAANAPLAFAPGTTAIPLGANGCAFATSWSISAGLGTVVAVPTVSFSGPASEVRNTRCEATRLHVENALISAGMGQQARACLFQNAAVRTVAEAQEAFLAASAEDPELAAVARRECLGQIAHQVAAQAIRTLPRPGRDG